MRFTNPGLMKKFAAGILSVKAWKVALLALRWASKAMCSIEIPSFASMFENRCRETRSAARLP
jgi:hypothetical protein